MAVETALENTALSLREQACLITCREGCLLSESSVYRILKAFDRITSLAGACSGRDHAAPSALDDIKQRTLQQRRNQNPRIQAV